VVGSGQIRFAWLVSFGVMLTGWIAAHCLGYWITTREAAVHHGLQGTEHGYFDMVPLLTLAATLVLVGFVGRLGSVVHRPTARTTPPTVLFLLAPLGFTFQEHLERALQLGTVDLGTMADPAVLLGFILQAPFALAAFTLARVLLASADALSLRLRSGHTRPIRAGVMLPIPSGTAFAPRVAPLAVGRSQRAPPLLLSDQFVVFSGQRPLQIRRRVLEERRDLT
jgi:hypothetical protein